MPLVIDWPDKLVPPVLNTKGNVLLLRKLEQAHNLLFAYRQYYCLWKKGIKSRI